MNEHTTELRDARWLALRHEVPEINTALDRIRGHERERDYAAAENARLRAALERLAGCDWTITLPDRMDGVRAIARDALDGGDPETKEEQP